MSIVALATKIIPFIRFGIIFLTALLRAVMHVARNNMVSV